MMHHTHTLKCVKAENLITELSIQLQVLKGKLRKKNIKISELEVLNKALRKKSESLIFVAGKMAGHIHKLEIALEEEGLYFAGDETETILAEWDGIKEGGK